MDKFSAKDICAIIKTCAQSNVQKVSIGDFMVEFGGVEEENVTSRTHTSGFLQVEAQDQVEEPSEVPSEPKLMTSEEKEVIRELQQSQLMFDDPEAFEQLMIDQHMGNGAALDG